MFFFKQKTAYERRISDWSSDVCSSDLTLLRRLPGIEEIAEHVDEAGALERHRDRLDAQADPLHALDVDVAGDLLGEHRQPFLGGGGAGRGQGQAAEHRLLEIGRASCRARVGQYV